MTRVPSQILRNQWISHLILRNQWRFAQLWKTSKTYHCAKRIRWIGRWYAEGSQRDKQFRGVLVAISIPIFTAQLEKSKEATDLANIRSTYAEIMTDALTDVGSTSEAVSPILLLFQLDNGCVLIGTFRPTYGEGRVRSVVFRKISRVILNQRRRLNYSISRPDVCGIQ
jgi:hypothetical protein